MTNFFKKHSIAYAALVFALIFYQLFLPLSLIKINADTESPANSEQAPTQSNTNSNGSSDNQNDNQDQDKNSNDNQAKSGGSPAATNSNQNNGADDAKENQNDNNELKPTPSCDVKNSELTDNCKEELKCDDVDKCLVKNTCEEVKKCLSTRIESVNNANINNNVSAEANSGNNEITQVSDNDNSSNGNCNTNAAEIGEANENTNNANINGESNGNINANENSSADPAPQSNENTNVNATENKENENNNSDAGQSATIETGDAVTLSDTYNEVNTNIVSNNYQQTVINVDRTYNGDINLLDQFQLLVNGDPNEIIPDPNGDLVISNENDAEVTNNIQTTANTGGNTISSENGPGDAAANIQTGDAVALSDTVNVVNTNIVGNNVLFAVVNIYGEWNGDLIVPGEGLLEVAPSPVYTETEITNENEVAIDNNVAVKANTGGNEIASEGSLNNAEVVSGATEAGAEVLNIVNTNIVKNNFFFLMINNLGSWTGQILNWNTETANYDNIFSYDFGTLDNAESPTINGILAIFNRNTAKIENNVNVTANTGGNIINTEGNGSQAGVYTGKAMAEAKVINFINTNIVGNNWFFGLVNVMGSWKGDTVFAYPDLTISIDDGKDQVDPSEEINYTVSYKNIGKAACDKTNVTITLPPYVHSDNNLSYSLPGLKPGEEKSFIISAVSSNDLPEGNTNLETLAGISTGTKEVKLDNNAAKDTTVAFYAAPTDLPISDDSYSPADFAGLDNQETPDNLAENYQMNSALTLTREVKDKTVRAGDIVDYSIFVENTGDVDLHGVVVSDEIKNKSGVVGSYSWKLGDVKTGKKFKIQYKLAINQWAPSGTYTSIASAYGSDPEENKVSAKEVRQKVSVLGNKSDSPTFAAN